MSSTGKIYKKYITDFNIWKEIQYDVNKKYYTD